MARAAGATADAWLAEGVAAWRKMRRRLRTGPIMRWRFAGRAPARLLAAPPDLRPADPQIAADIYHGRFALNGHTLEAGGASPFALAAAPLDWQEALHAFRWLRHMRAAGSGLASLNARALVADWIESHGGRLAGVAWEPGTVARRLVAWLSHSPTVLASAVNGGVDHAFQRLFLRSLGAQVRFLRAVAGETPDAAERLHLRIALAFAALCLPASPASLRRSVRALSLELEHQILPDGGHVSRNPEVLVELLLDLLPLRQTFASRNVAPPEALMGAVERMLPMLRFFRHGDGTLARFNGVGATAHDRVNAVLRHDGVFGAPLGHAPFSGYQRLSAGGTLVIADTGAAAPAETTREAHAGCLSFEMSSGETPARARHFIVNAGTDRLGAADFRPLARATAAHSTAILNDASSARFRPSGALLAGPRQVTAQRLDSAEAQGFAANHDGYLARFGLIHRRELILAADGATLSGRDRFLRPDGNPPRPGSDRAAVRFHLHPDVEVMRDETGALVLHVPGGDYWTLHAPDLAPAVEESIFFASLRGPRRTRQIVFGFDPGQLAELRWRWTRHAG